MSRTSSGNSSLPSLIAAPAVVAGLFMFMLTQPAPGQSPPTADETVVDAMDYRTDAAAQAAWRPMFGTAPVATAKVDGRTVLQLRCNFRNTRIDRACWDRAVRLDMTACRALRFRMLCRDRAPIAHFSIYLQSGAGWYAATFAPAVSDGWSTIVIDKEATRMEGAPAGWADIRTIRISAWRGADEDTELALADMAMIGGRGDVCIVRNESVAATSPREVEAVCQFTQLMGARFAELGLEYRMVSDLDLSGERLKDARLAILPHTPALSAAAMDAIREHLKKGGRLLACYTLPAPLAGEVGIEVRRHVSRQSPGQFASMRFVEPLLPGAPPVVRQASWNVFDARPTPGRGRVIAEWYDLSGKPSGYPAIVAADNAVFVTHVLLDDDPAGKRRMLLALAGHLVPELWAKATQYAVGRLGRFGPYADWNEATGAIARLAPAAAAGALAAAAKHRQEAHDLCAAGRWAEAMESVELAHRGLVEAWCAAQSPRAGEQRGFWCHSAFAPAGMTWDQAIRHLAENGFNAIFPNMLWGGLAYYESAVLPVAPEVRERGDQIALCAAACRKYGVACHVWKVNWNMSGRAPGNFARRMKETGRTQVRFDGSANDTWLCPSHPDNRQLETDSMVEVATRYDVDGIHFDYIRYPDANGCFCPGCRQRFEQTIGRTVGNWPADVRRNAELAARWLDFRRDNITRTVAAVADAARKVKPGIKISAAVFPNWTVDRDTIGQDWRLWCERGYVDFVCPMNYTPHNVAFESLLRRQLQWAGNTPVYPGIGLSTWGGSSDDLCRLIEQISIARKLGARGFTIFEYRSAEAADIVPMCGKGITRRQ